MPDENTPDAEPPVPADEAPTPLPEADALDAAPIPRGESEVFYGSRPREDGTIYLSEDEA